MNQILDKKWKLILIFLSILLSLLAQQLLLNNQFIIAGVIFLFSIGLLFIINRKYSPTGLQIKSVLINPDNKQLKLSMIYGGMSILLAVMSFFVFNQSQHNQFAWVFHFISLLLFLRAVWIIDPIKVIPKINIKKIIKKNYLLLLILLIGGLLRFIQLDNIPYGLWYDEADFGLNAMRILSEPGFSPVFFERSRVPAYFIYFLALSFKMFGISITSLRMVSAFFGLLTIVVAYFCAKEMFNYKTAIVFAFLIAVSRWNVNWSRIGLDNITIPFFELLVVSLLYLAISKKKFIYFSIAGISLGLGLSFYASMRIFPLVIFIWLLAIGIYNKKFIPSFWKEGLIFGISVLITIVPIAQYAVFNPEPFWGRIEQTSIFKGKSTQEAWNAISKTSKEHLLMFNYKGDRNGRHNLPGEPMMDAITAPLMVLGLGLSLTRIRYPKYMLILFWWLIMLVPGIFSLDFESPQSLRAIGSLPAAYLLAVIPLNELLRIEPTIFGRKNRIMMKVLISGLLIIIGFINFNMYFNQQMRSTSSWIEFSTRETIIGKRMSQIGSEAEFFISTFYFNTPTIRFLAPNITSINNFQTYDLIPFEKVNNKQLVFYIDEERETFFKMVQDYFPNGKFEAIKDPNGKIILYEIIMHPSDFEENRGLITNYYKSSDPSEGIIKSQIEKEFTFLWEDRQIEDAFSFVEWEGILVAPLFGEYRFFHNENNGFQMFIDNQKVDVNFANKEDKKIILAKGNHKIRFLTESNTGLFELKWQPPNQEIQPLTSSLLYKSPISTNGLLGKYFSSTDWSGPVAYAQIDPVINFNYHNQPISRPYTVLWEGFIVISKEGQYGFGLSSRDESSLYLNDRLLMTNSGSGQRVEATVQLEIGNYPIQIKYSDKTGYTFITLYWTQPEQKIEIVPSNVLLPW